MKPGRLRAPLPSLLAARRRFESGDPRTAAAMARRIATGPHPPPDAVVLWGVAAAEAGDFLEAIPPLRAAADLLRDHADRRVLVDLQLGRSLIAYGRWREGLEILAPVEERQPAEAYLRHRLALGLTGAGLLERALPHLWFAVDRRRHDAGMTADLAWVLAGLGRIDVAERFYEDAIALAPTLARAHAGLSTLRRWTADHNHVDRLSALLETPTTPDERATIGYAIFKELDDLNRHAEAWRELERANRTLSAMDPWSAAADADLVEAIIRAFPAGRAPRRVEEKSSTEGLKPIFVVGLPRTGSTLVERILSAHSDVADVGEAPFFPMAFKAAAGLPANGPITAATIGAVRDADWERAGADYLREVGALSRGAGNVVDKLPFNSLLAGAIRLALPGARIVLVERDPMDSLWSAHRNPFARGGWYGWTRTQSDLAAHWSNHRRLMNHWRDVLGPEFIEVRYEDLVTDTEATVRMLLDRCGLTHQDACFHPDRADGAVTTLSQVAVRQPVNRNAIGAWRPYSRQLSELRGALESAADV